MSSVAYGNALDELRKLPDASIDLIYTDPPFNTGQHQKSARSGLSYLDKHDDYMSWVKQWVSECHRVLADHGTIYLHLDEREAYKVRLLVLDAIFGEQNYLSTVIWAYDFGGRGKDRWPAKHDVILVYAKLKGKHTFNWDAIERIPYMAPGLQKDQTRATAGKVPTDVWWMSIVGTNSKERIGYPNQKPRKLIERAIQASSNPGAIVLDPFAGSGTTGDAAASLGRKFMLFDNNPDAIKVMNERLAGYLTCSS
jgi:site-specific DNA-methyltransferase (adenine-specific)